MAGGPALPIYEPWKQDTSLPQEQNTVYGYVTMINHVGRVIEACHPTPPGHTNFQPHLVTYLKLLLVCSYARQCFLPIGANATSRLVYLDILSASGLSVAKEAPTDPIAGSCFITPMAKQDISDFTKPANPAFSEVHTFDYEATNLKLLQARRDALCANTGLTLPSFLYHPGDANASVPALVAAEAQKNLKIQSFKARPLYLMFVDNQALDIHMSTIKALQGTDGFRGDLIVHLPTRSIWRAIQGARASPSNSTQALDDFFGSPIWKTIKDEDDIPSVYHQVVQKVTHSAGDGFQEAEPVRINGAKTKFALCFYIRKTSGLANPKGWLDIIKKQADACNKLDEDRVKAIVSRSTKKQKGLFGFGP